MTHPDRPFSVVGTPVWRHQGRSLIAFVLLFISVGLTHALSESSAPSAAASSALPASEAGTRAGAETASVAQQDERLVRELLARLSRIEALSEVSVRVNAGVATLTGEVPTEEDRQRAEKLAQEVSGIVEVDNLIRLDTSPAVRLRPAMGRLQEAAGRLVATLPLLMLALLLVWLMSRLGRWIGDRRLMHKLVGGHPFLVDLLRQTVRFGMVLLGLIIALDLLDATALVSAVIGTAGLAGLILGFALRDLVENYIAGLLLSLRQPFAPNDHVVIDGNEGKVAALTTRATTLITLDGNHLRLPNALVFKGVILNYSRNPQRRFTFRIGVGVKEDLARVRHIGVCALRALPGVLAEPPPLALVMELGESSVNFEFSGWFDQRQDGFFKLRSDAIRALKAALDAEGVDLPEPTYRVQLSRQGRDTREGAAPYVELPDLEEESVERAVDDQVAREQALSGESNLLKQDAPRE